MVPPGRNPATRAATPKSAAPEAALTEERVRALIRAELRARSAEPLGTPYCSFCGKSQHLVTALIVSPTAMICDECVDICVLIVEQKREEKRQRRKWIRVGARERSETVAPQVEREGSREDLK